MIFLVVDIAAENKLLLLSMLRSTRCNKSQAQQLFSADTF